MQNLKKASLNYKQILENASQIDSSMVIEDKDIYKKQQSRNFSDIE